MPGETVPAGIIEPDAPILPDSWRASSELGVFDETGYPDRPVYQQVQLALCMSSPENIGSVVGTCDYSESGYGDLKIKVVAASYGFTLIETRTGHVVKSFQIQASDPVGFQKADAGSDQ